MSATCFVCEEYYRREINPAMTLVPCGHIACQPCIKTWRKENNSCPQCRNPIQKVIINRGLMDLIEETKTNPSENKVIQQKSNVIHAPKSTHHTTNTITKSELFKKSFSAKDKTAEIINDKCEMVIYIIDNSKSMEYYSDGKIFTRDDYGIITKKNGVLRWDEAKSKLQKIAKYNIKRKICASYYLLNPSNYTKKSSNWTSYIPYMGSNCDVSNWKENIDFITIDPQSCDDIMCRQKYDILIQNILSEYSIRGDTPLDVITQYFGRNLGKFIDCSKYKNKAICYNIVTDGEPNNKSKFEKELRYLANNYNIFLVINLCTEDDGIVDYYNELDTKIGKELSGCDVIDDLESEQKEIVSVGNTFFVYCEEIHICRMAGCYSIIGDLMDEQRLSVYHACKLCNELCDLGKSGIGFNEREKYVEMVRKSVERKPNVYDYGRRKFAAIIDVNKLDWLIWYQESSENSIKLGKTIRYLLHQYPSVGLIIVALLCVLFLKSKF
eukprot:65732_1